jgi:hypothetical protein
VTFGVEAIVPPWPAFRQLRGTNWAEEAWREVFTAVNHALPFNKKLHFRYALEIIRDHTRKPSTRDEAEKLLIVVEGMSDDRS